MLPLASPLAWPFWPLAVDEGVSSPLLRGEVLLGFRGIGDVSEARSD